MIKILSPETHVSVAVVNAKGEIVCWQQQPFFTLADLWPSMVRWMSNRTSTTRPDEEKFLRNHRVFTGCVYLKLDELDEQTIQDGDTALLDERLQVKFPDGWQGSFIFNSLWSSATKSQTLTGYLPQLNTPLRKVFNYAEAGVRVGRATRGGFSNGKVEHCPVQFLPQDTELDFGTFTKPLGDGEFIIRESDAVVLRRAMNFMGERYMNPFTLGQWRLSVQLTSQVKHPFDQEGVMWELLPHVAEGLDRINNHAEFIAHAFKLGMKDESEKLLLDLAEEMYDHPDLNSSLSVDRARLIFDTITTGRPKSVQGFVAIAGGKGAAVFPSQQTRFPKSELYLLARYPINNSRCIMPVVAIQEGPQADFLNEVEQFQGTLFGTDGEGQFMAPGQFIVVPDHYWPAEYADVRLISCSKNIKVCSTWKSADDVKATQSATRRISYKGYISVCQWAHKGNGVMVDPETWGQSNGDFDFDTGEAAPESEFPLTFEAFRKEWEITVGLAVSKLPKVYTFDDPEAPRTKTLVDTLAGAMAVGMAANCNLVVLNNDPKRWPEIAKKTKSDTYFYTQMVGKGYITESYTDELVAYFAEICQCSEQEAEQVIRMFYVLSFFIQCGVDGFKTNLSSIGGMTKLVEEIGRFWKVLTKKMGLSQRVIQYNPKKNAMALRDKQHRPQYGEDEQVFGVSETLMKMAIEGFTWEGWPQRLELPDYLYLGAPLGSFKYWSVGPRTEEELEGIRLLRKICRMEMTRRSMMTPKDWALFAETFWRPLVHDFQQNGRIILRYRRTIGPEGKPVYAIAKEHTFPGLAGISWERLAHLLWFAFHDADGSIVPLFWVKELVDHLLDIIKRKPGRVDLQDEFDLPVLGLSKTGRDYDTTYVVDVRLERFHEEVKVGDELADATRRRNVIEFTDGTYLMLPKDAPLLNAARFNLTIRREGSQDIGHFERLTPLSTTDLAGRLRALTAQFADHS